MPQQNNMFASLKKNTATIIYICVCVFFCAFVYICGCVLCVYLSMFFLCVIFGRVGTNWWQTHGKSDQRNTFIQIRLFRCIFFSKNKQKKASFVIAIQTKCNNSTLTSDCSFSAKLFWIIFVELWNNNEILNVSNITWNLLVLIKMKRVQNWYFGRFSLTKTLRY